MFIEMSEREERLKRLRRLEAAKLELDRRIERRIVLPPEPGVYEEEIHPPGERWFKIVLPSGQIGIVHFPEELCDPALLRNLWKRYWARTRRKLKIV